MLNKNILLSIFLVPLIVHTNYCQDTDQKIQQLKEVWLQKAQELAGLCEQMVQQYNQVKGTILEVHEYLETLTDDPANKEKDHFKKDFFASMTEFGRSLGKAFTDDVNVKGFLIKTCISNKEDQFGFDMVHVRLFKYFIERALLKKLIEKTDQCFQELADIDHKIFVLNGELSLLF